MNSEKRTRDEGVEVEEQPKIQRRRLSTDDVVFSFFSKSVDAAPGLGKQECLKNGRSVSEFAELQSISNWRQKLSNFWIAPFEYDGLSWASVEHLYHALKFREQHPDFYRKFSLSTPNSRFNRDPLLAKAAGGKTGILHKGKKDKQVILRPSSIKADPVFFTPGVADTYMEQAQEAKFSQHEDLRNLLLATKDATLRHIMRGKSVDFVGLMNIRNRLAVEKEQDK